MPVTDSGKVISTMEHSKRSKAAKKGARSRVGKPLSSSTKLKIVKTRAKDARMGVNSKGVKLSVLAVKKGKPMKSAIKPISTMSCKGKK